MEDTNFNILFAIDDVLGNFQFFFFCWPSGGRYIFFGIHFGHSFMQSNRIIFEYVAKKANNNYAVRCHFNSGRWIIQIFTCKEKTIFSRLNLFFGFISMIIFKIFVQVPETVRIQRKRIWLGVTCILDVQHYHRIITFGYRKHAQLV